MACDNCLQLFAIVYNCLPAKLPSPSPNDSFDDLLLIDSFIHSFIHSICPAVLNYANCERFILLPNLCKLRSFIRIKYSSHCFSCCGYTRSIVCAGTGKINKKKALRAAFRFSTVPYFIVLGLGRVRCKALCFFSKPSSRVIHVV